MPPTDGFGIRRDEGIARPAEESQLEFAVTRNGRPVQLQDYLGAKGHLVALRQSDLAYLHVHSDSLKFMAMFPTADIYRLFLQFKVDGSVHTAAFTEEVSRERAPDAGDRCTARSVRRCPATPVSTDRG